MGLNINKTTPVELDRYFLRTSLWPAVLYTTLLMLVGTVGNILVIIVYRRQFRRSVTRMFIYTLAILDLGNCLITMPAELMILIHFTTFPSPEWCKLSRYLTYTFNGTSSIILITIALDRYFKVCRPTQVYIDVRKARLICLGAFLFTALCSLPALIIYGDMELPVMVSGDEATIVPLNSKLLESPASSDLNLTATPKSLAVTSAKYFNRYSADRVPLSQKDSSVFFIYGRFCLLNSDYIDSSLPLLFYVSMFALYVIMVVLVIFFYSKVARAMFILTSKHSKMFTFYGANNSTPASNSVIPEEGAVFFHRAGSNVIINEPSVDYGTDDVKENSDVTRPRDRLLGEEKLIQNKARHCEVGTGQNCDHKTVVPKSQGTVSETGYETGDTNSNCGTRHAHDQQQASSDICLTDGRIDNPGVNAPMSGSCDVVVHCDNSSAEKDSKTWTPAKSRSVGDLISSPHSSSPGGANSKSLSKKGSKKKVSQKIPKIKVQEVSTKDNDLHQVIYYPPADRLDLSLYPLSSNSLLLRRIKSAENINSLSRLYKLHVPDGRGKRQPFLPDKNGQDTIRRDGNRKPQHRQTAEGIGKVSNSCVNLDLVGGSDDTLDASKSRDKTWTLTKTSPKGKKRLCTLPLTGLSTKTALHVQDDQQMMVTVSENILTGEGRSTQSLSRGGVVASTTIHTPQNLSSPDLDSEVTMRQRSPESTGVSHSRGNTLSSDGKILESVTKSQRTPRQEIVSTADILQEHHQRGSLHPIRTSRMLFIISLVFVISFLPFFVIALVRSSEGSSFMTSLSDVQLGVVSVFIRSSLISNAVNPIVYGLLSTHFRRECTGLVCCIFRHRTL